MRERDHGVESCGRPDVDEAQKSGDNGDQKNAAHRYHVAPVNLSLVNIAGGKARGTTHMLEFVEVFSIVLRSPTLKRIAIEAPKANVPLMKNAITMLCGTTFSESLTSSPAFSEPSMNPPARDRIKVPTNAHADARSPMPQDNPLLRHPPAFSKFANTNEVVLCGDR
ncbi:MAG: hypothetical protein Q9177_005952 [Variospora cf. flavescens]